MRELMFLALAIQYLAGGIVLVLEVYNDNERQKRLITACWIGIHLLISIIILLLGMLGKV